MIGCFFLKHGVYVWNGNKKSCDVLLFYDTVLHWEACWNTLSDIYRANYIDRKLCGGVSNIVLYVVLNE